MSTLHVEVHGDGPPLVLLHGWALNVRVWDSLLPALIPRFKVIAMDLAGHGRSAWHPAAKDLDGHARLVAATYAQLADEEPSVVAQGTTILGWSFGGQVALTLAALDAESKAQNASPSHADKPAINDVSPLKIDKLVLTATSPKFAASPDWPHGLAAPVLAHFAQELQNDYRQTVSDFLDLQVRGSANSSAVLGLLRNALFVHGEATREALTEGLKTLESADLRPRLPEIRQRSLVISGQYDRVTPSAAGKALAASLPDASFLEIRRAGHAPFLSHLDSFLEALFDATT